MTSFYPGSPSRPFSYDNAFAMISNLRSLVWSPLVRSRLCVCAVVALIVAVGIVVRVLPWSGFNRLGFDEALYRNDLTALDQSGLGHYPALCGRYIQEQRQPGAATKLPPTRFLYLYCGWIVKRAAFGNTPPTSPKAPGFMQRDPELNSLRYTSALFSSLLFLTAGVYAWRMLGTACGLGVLALMACSPIQIHMAQHALIDGFFAFWAMLCLWLLWENLRHPNHWGWLATYGISLALMVMTKENAFFVFTGLCGLVAINRWAKFGNVTSRLLLVMVLGPLAGVAALVQLAGGLDAFVDIYRILVTSAEKNMYAIMTGDGPWHRYLVDLMIVSPAVLCLAIGGVFTSVKTSRPLLYLGAFVGFTYLLMCNVKFGMNLRYATIWEFPIYALATTQVAEIARCFGKRASLVGVLILIALCAYSLRQYVIFFVDYGLYELVSEGLLRAVKIIK